MVCKKIKICGCLVTKSYLTLLRPYGLQPARLLFHFHLDGNFTIDTTEVTQTMCRGDTGHQRHPQPAAEHHLTRPGGLSKLWKAQGGRKRWMEWSCFHPVLQGWPGPLLTKNRSGASQLLSLPWGYAWVSLSCLLGERAAERVTRGEMSSVGEQL